MFVANTPIALSIAKPRLNSLALCCHLIIKDHPTTSDHVIPELSSLTSCCFRMIKDFQQRFRPRPSTFLPMYACRIVCFWDGSRVYWWTGMEIDASLVSSVNLRPHAATLKSMYFSTDVSSLFHWLQNSKLYILLASLCCSSRSNGGGERDPIYTACKQEQKNIPNQKTSPKWNYRWYIPPHFVVSRFQSTTERGCQS